MELTVADMELVERIGGWELILVVDAIDNSLLQQKQKQTIMDSTSAQVTVNECIHELDESAAAVIAAPMEQRNATNSAMHQQRGDEIDDDSIKFPDYHDQLVSVNAVPIVSVEIDGPHDDMLQQMLHATEHDNEAHQDGTTIPMATASLMPPFHMEQGEDYVQQDEASVHAIKILKRRNTLLAMIAVLLLAAVCVGIGNLIGKDRNDLDDAAAHIHTFCSKQMSLLNVCLDRNDRNDATNCRNCVEQVVPILREDANEPFCSSSNFNATVICSSVQDCAAKDYCAYSCYSYMVSYMQCLLATKSTQQRHGGDGENETLFSDFIDNECLLPCSWNGPVSSSSVPTIVPSGK
ncbi:hypothetical protein MPSEU_000200900 [Mayamaea pseudoterrestris]|nr:hypothetical protein MPSEU_000200900 [Mayamaea pseudoterrestris]